MHVHFSKQGKLREFTYKGNLPPTLGKFLSFKNQVMHLVESSPCKKSLGVTLDVNLRNPPHAGGETYKCGDPSLAFKPRTDVAKSLKRGTGGPTRWTDVFQFFLQKKKDLLYL